MSDTARGVPETAAGFLYQLERALYRLAAADNPATLVGVEVDDDVAEMTSENTGSLEQSKLSHARSGQPFQDRSVGLWKTLDIWTGMAASGTDFQKNATLYLVTNRTVPKASLAWKISRQDQDDAAVATCLAALKDKGENPSDTIKAHVTSVMGRGDAVLEDVIRRITLLDSKDGTSSSELEAKTIALFRISPEVPGKRVYDGVLGWATRLLQETWRRKEPGWISREQLDRQVFAIARGFFRERVLERAARLVVVSPDEKSHAKAEPFVAKLLDILISESEIDSAIDCYLRHMTENFRLAREGDVTANDWSDFYDHLRLRWNDIRQRISRIAQREGWEEILQGQRVFEDTTPSDFCAPLAGRQTLHSYLTKGGYHRLANTNKLWWLPKAPPSPLPTTPT